MQISTQSEKVVMQLHMYLLIIIIKQDDEKVIINFQYGSGVYREGVDGPLP